MDDTHRFIDGRNRFLDVGSLANKFSIPNFILMAVVNEPGLRETCQAFAVGQMGLICELRSQTRQQPLRVICL